MFNNQSIRAVVNRNLLTPALLAVALCLGLAASTAHAQTDYSNSRATSSLTIGPGFQGGASMIIESPEGQKVKPIFAYRAGVDVTYPISSRFGATLALGLDNRGTRLHAASSSDAYTDTRVSYFTVMPGFQLSGFVIGLNIGFPMSGWHKHVFISGDPEIKDFTDAENDNLKVMLEPRLGVVVPVVDEEVGWLGFSLTGGITLGEPFLPPGYDRLPEATRGNFTVVSLHAGLTWQFAIPGTARK